MLQLIRRLLGRAPKSQLPPFNFARNRFKAKKQWPPQLRELTPKQQFRFERKYKRRMLLKVHRPEWNRKVKIATWTIIGFLVVWSAFIHDFTNDPWIPEGQKPFEGLRIWTRGLFSGLWTHTREEGHQVPARREVSQAAGADVDERAARTEGPAGADGAAGLATEPRSH